MAKSRVPAGAGSIYYVDATQIPTDLDWESVPSTTNRLKDGVKTIKVLDAATASSDFVWFFTAEDNGVIEALRYENGGVAADGTNGWELQFIDVDNSNADVGYFGIGSGTEAAKGTDNDTAVAIGGFTEIVSTTAQGFNKGDKIQVTADRDGTTIVGNIELVVSYESEGRR